ncbi:site-2 protease family protein [Candidatus Peregrinibacteria bacterium]|nr:site-2 protease family protein [Candidatus Peregrinibacteria bacterium]
MILITIVAFIVIFSILVLVHEFGHFTAARQAGIHVEEFGLGLPPKAKVLRKDKHGTEYTLNWIPFGGFVRLMGEDSSDAKVLKDKRSFASKSAWKRITVVVAGVLMNFVLAWVLITIGFSVGMKPFLATQADVDKAVSSGIVETRKIFLVHEIDPAMPLAKTELKKGDYIVSVNGQAVTDTMELSKVVLPNAVNTLAFMHEGKELALQVPATPEGKLGMAISLENFVVKVNDVRYPVYLAPLKAIGEVGRLSVLTVHMLGDVIVTLVTKLAVPDGVAGPVGIAKMTNTFAKQGFMALVQFAAMLSISLGVINIMPFPALDGGRLLFILFEVVLRRRMNAKWETIAHTVGYALLMVLILAITWNDIWKLFH